MTVLNDNHMAFRKMVRELAVKEIAPKAALFDHGGEFPWDNVKKMAQMGLLGLTVPEAYGGNEEDTLTYIIAVEEVARACASTSCILAVHNSAAILPILWFGTEEQKNAYLPQMAEGVSIGGFALTEPGAGSDAAAVRSSAVRQESGEWVLNGTKCFITNGEVADVFTVFAKTDPTKGVKGLSAFIVEKGTPGLSVGKHEDKMGIRASSTTDLILEECRVPAANLLGKEGEGFRIAMSVLDSARIGIGAQAVGIAQGALDEAVRYSKEREQFGAAIANLQGIQFMLADMATKVEVARQMVYHTAQLKDAGKPYGKEAAMSKLFASDSAMAVTTDAVQILGGYGYMREYPVERMMRDAKITQIYEGTNQIQRVVIANHLLK